MEITDKGKAIVEMDLSLREAHAIDHQDPEFDMPEPTRLMIAGDWHGARHWSEKTIEEAKARDCDAILQLGDFGYWPKWDDHTMTQTGTCHFSTKVRGWAEQYGIPVYWIDGNHENHEALAPGQGDEWLRHLPRGHRWNWWGKTWMSVGGGVSVDQHLRTPFLDWFPGEELNSKQMEYCLREGDVDIVVAHDCPNGVDIPGIHADEKTDSTNGFFPSDLIRLSNNHRKLVGMIADDKNPAYWFHGHYHTRYNAVRKQEDWIEGGPAMSVHGLDMQGARNAIVLTKEDLA